MSEQKVIHILLATRDKTSLSGLKTGLEENQVQITWAKSSSDAINKITEGNFDLIVTDENLGAMTGLELIKKVISKKPLINCATVSSLLPADFHEASEGLGILMQLPVRLGQKQAENLFGQLKNILNLAQKAATD